MKEYSITAGIEVTVKGSLEAESRAEAYDMARSAIQSEIPGLIVFIDVEEGE